MNQREYLIPSSVRWSASHHGVPSVQLAKTMMSRCPDSSLWSLVALLLYTPGNPSPLEHAHSYFTVMYPSPPTKGCSILDQTHNLVLLTLLDGHALKSPSGCPSGRACSVTILIGLLLGQPVSAAGRGRGFSGLKRIISAWRPALNTEIQPPSRDYLRLDAVVAGRWGPLCCTSYCFPFT